MTTNGSLLASRAQRLKKFGLNRVNISLDSLETEAFATCVGKDGAVGVCSRRVYVALLMLTLNPLRLIRFYLVIGPMMKLNLYYNMLKNGLLFGGLLNTCRSKVMPFMGLPLMNGRNN